MTGIILCGGQSLRMGSDKGLLPAGTTSWVQLAFNKLLTLNIPVYLSVNENQVAEYKKIFPIDSLIRDNDFLNIKGPLLGLLSAYLQFRGEDIFVLACDMPLINSSIIHQLLAAYKNDVNGDAFIFSNNGNAEPLCGIYKSSGMDRILEMYSSGHLVKNSMKFVLNHIATIAIPLEENQKKYFRNFNSQSDLDNL